MIENINFFSLADIFYGIYDYIWEYFLMCGISLTEKDFILIDVLSLCSNDLFLSISIPDIPLEIYEYILEWEFLGGRVTLTMITAN